MFFLFQTMSDLIDLKQFFSVTKKKPVTSILLHLQVLEGNSELKKNTEKYLYVSKCPSDEATIYLDNYLIFIILYSSV